MAKYLVLASYTSEGTKGLLREGGAKRKAAVDELMRGLGGRLESFYYAFGDVDVYAVIELPDNVTAASASLAVNASGFATIKTIPLLAPEDIDQAVKKTVAYRPPGK
jgi:uncharacterized protein with GYD domain